MGHRIAVYALLKENMPVRTVLGLAWENLIGDFAFTTGMQTWNVTNPFTSKDDSEAAWYAFAGVTVGGGGGPKTAILWRAAQWAFKLGMKDAKWARRANTVLKKTGLAKPVVSDPNLKKIIDNVIYKAAGKPGCIGTGSTADAVRWSALTGERVGGIFHRIAAEERIRSLEKWLVRYPSASARDRQVARLLIDDMVSALWLEDF
jgi:hypothetical protein